MLLFMAVFINSTINLNIEKMKKVVTVLLSIMVLTACWNKREEMTGYAPIYASPTQIKTISLTTAQPYENGGKIYVYGHTLYQVENGKGIHITDISNPAAPEKKGFIKVTGCQEISVKNAPWRK